MTADPSTPRGYGALFQGPKRPPTVTDQGSPYQPPRVIGYQGPSPALAGRLRGSQAPQGRPLASFPPRHPGAQVVDAGNRAQEPTWGAGSRRPGLDAAAGRCHRSPDRGSPKGVGVPARPKYYYFVAGACRDITW